MPEEADESEEWDVSVESDEEEQALRASAAAAPAPASHSIRRVRRTERVITDLLLGSVERRSRPGTAGLAVP
ncbi:hypothetical protein GCM10010345_88330 [Streptomyces canarius]|uniref:Uncharacterized protein n=1 Tax=Streptomyces canarius TaxID=285453 RepID=A0ABQ3DCL3_9ACTN|nr:hypothetical protein GCM10010345_88330 [Streptomyces canarius]